MNETAILYWLTAGTDVSTKAVNTLLGTFDPRALWRMDNIRLSSFPFISDKAVSVLSKRRDESLILSEIKQHEKDGINLLSCTDPRFPESLRHIDDPPVLLYYKGRLPDPDTPRIAVIGARKCTPYGLAGTKEITKGLALSGFVVVSGLARGIDAQAHKTAVDTAVGEHGEGASVSTVAVLGCGVDVCYPHENRLIYQGVIKNGCVISEYPPGTTPLPYYFPRRNRIITGLSLGIIVIEAAEKSGTGKTVELALSQGREVFVLPGSVFSSASTGTNNLIKDGAIPVTNYLDVLYALRRELTRSGFVDTLPANERTGDGNDRPILQSEERLILKHLSDNPTDADDLAVHTGLAAQDVSYFLSKMELVGLVKSVSKGYIAL